MCPAQPRGSLCGGVDRAITIVERALEQFGAPIYVRHEIVHNKYVVGDLRDKGAVFIEELFEAPDGSTVIFSAHGVLLAVRDEAQRRNLHIFDATCPLVTKVHVEVKRMREQGYEIIMIGHKGHPEAEGTMGQVKDGIYLVDTEADVANLQVKHPIIWHTSRKPHCRLMIPKALRRSNNASQKSPSRKKPTSATPHKTAKTRLKSSRRRLMW